MEDNTPCVSFWGDSVRRLYCKNEVLRIFLLQLNSDFIRVSLPFFAAKVEKD